MIYHVTAVFKEEKAAEILAKLADGTIGNQKPDGAEMVESMNRAVVNRDGRIEWTELCFCPTPLQHERATVLDTFFDDIDTAEISDQRTFVGRPFMEFLQELSVAAPAG